MIEVKCDRCGRATKSTTMQTTVMRVTIMGRCTPVETKSCDHIGHYDLCRGCRTKLRERVEQFIAEKPATHEPEPEHYP